MRLFQCEAYGKCPTCGAEMDCVIVYLEEERQERQHEGIEAMVAEHYLASPDCRLKNIRRLS